MRRLLLLLLGLLCLGAGAAPLPRTVVFVSLDGLKADDALASDAPATLRRLKAEGAWAEGVEPVVPPVTYPNHATLATGVRPLRHGISTNVALDPPGEWRFYAEHLRATPLWEAVRARGGRVAALSWPVTVGADIDLLVPEYFRYGLPGDAPLLDALCRPPGLLRRLVGSGPAPDRRRGLDDFLAGSAETLLREDRPDLLMLHLVDLDHAQHESGPGSPEARSTLEAEDRRLGRLLAALPQGAVLVLASDHGFTPVREDISVPVLMQRTGLGERFLAEAAGGYCGLSWKGEPDEAVLAQALATLAAVPEIARVLTRADLDAVGAFPGAALALESRDARVFSSRKEGPLVGPSRNKGAHGFDPRRPDQQAAFFAWGRGVRPGRLPRLRMIDVAPTVAGLLDVRLPEAEGRAQEILAEEPR